MVTGTTEEGTDCLATSPGLSYSSYSFLGDRISVRRKRVADTVLARKNERKAVLWRNFSWWTLAHPTSSQGRWRLNSGLRRDPAKVWVVTGVPK